MKQAKGFSLAELDQQENTFQVDQNSNSAEQSEEAIVLDILGDSTNPLVQLNGQVAAPKNNTVDLYKSYQKLNSKLTFKRGLPLHEKAIFFELVSTMLAAGISVLQSIRVFSEQTKNKYFKTIAQAISYELEKGKSLSETLQSYRYIFSEAEIGMIKSGEITGRLNEVLKRLSVETLASIELQRKIRSALIYPGIVVVFVVATLYVMLRFVIPQMSDLFDSTGLELPAITRFLVTLSNFIVDNGFLVILAGLGFLIATYFFTNSKLGKAIFHRAILNLPVLAEFFKSINQARFARSISNLLSAGISIVEAVNITARSITNVVYKSKIELIARDIEQGINISESIQDSPYFSNLTISMISVGEKTAQLDDLAKQIAEYYEAKTADMAENFSKLIQPFVIAIVGAMVGAIVLAIMLPMTELIGGIDSL